MSLGNSYSELPTGDRADNLRNAISCYEAAATVFLEHSFLVEWAGAQSSLGMAYSQLPTGDRATNLGKVIACYEAALRVYTREANTYPWTAAAQNNLGAAYTELPTGDPAANLRKAIACYEAAFQGFSSLRMDGYAQAATSNLKVVKDALERLDQPPQPGPEMV